MTRRHAKNAALALAVVSVMLLVGQMDYQDEGREQRHYCEMVEAGHWPDFRPQTDCGD